MRNNVKLTKGQEYLVETLEGTNKVDLEVTFVEESHDTIEFTTSKGKGYTLVKSSFANTLNLTRTNGYNEDGVHKILYTIYLTSGKLVTIYEKESTINVVLELNEDEIITFKENKELDILTMNVEDDHEEAEVVLTRNTTNDIIAVLQTFANKK